MRVKPLLLAALVAIPLAAAPRPSVDASGAFFALTVRNLDSASAWYADKFGLRTTMTVPRTNGVAVRVLEGNGLIIELQQRDRAQALPGDAGDRYGFFKAGIIVADFDRTLAELRAKHAAIAYGPFTGGAGQPPNVIIRDPDGNLVQLIGR